MGERDNGYARCDLRRGLRGRGAGLGGEMQRQIRYDGCGRNDCDGRGDGRSDGGDNRYGNNRNAGCGICNVLRGGSGRYDNAYEGREKSSAWEHRYGSSVRGRADGRNGCACESDRPALGVCAGKECHELMNKLQQLDFSLQEVVLYLDGYPDCPQALDYYHQLLQERCAVAQAYEKSCGPLTTHGNHGAQGWDWVQSPWPWHHEFPGNKHG